MTHTQVFLDASSKPRPSAAVRHNDGTTVSVGCRWNGVSNALTVFGTFAEVQEFIGILQQELDILAKGAEAANALSN